MGFALDSDVYSLIVATPLLVFLYPSFQSKRIHQRIDNDSLRWINTLLATMLRIFRLEGMHLNWHSTACFIPFLPPKIDRLHPPHQA